jgi:hypothetical protein
MRKMIVTCAGAAALFAATAFAPPLAQAMTIAAPAGLAKAARAANLTEDVAYVCRAGWRWRRCWWTPAMPTIDLTITARPTEPMRITARPTGPMPIGRTIIDLTRFTGRTIGPTHTTGRIIAPYSRRTGITPVRIIDRIAPGGDGAIGARGGDRQTS